MTRLRLAAACLTLATACSKEIIVVECDGHEPEEQEDASGRADAGSERTDAARPGEDASPQGADAGIADGAASPADAAAGCDPYCIRSIEASSSRVNVREIVTLTAHIENPRATVLTFRVPPKASLTGERKPMRPPFVPA